MVAIPVKFDPTAIPEDDRNFDPLPAGQYKMQVIESRMQDTKSGSGQMLVLTLEILDGPYQNRKLWDQLNIINDSADAVRISQIALKALCDSVGVDIGKLTDSETLHFKPFTATVRVQADKTGQYPPQNRVRYGATNQQAQSGVKTTPQQAAAARQQNSTRPAQGGKPWNNPKQQAAPAEKDMDDKIPF